MSIRKPPKDLLFEIGNRVREARLVNNLTREQLAEKIDISVRCLASIELGTMRCSIFTLMDLSNALNVTTDYLLKGDLNCKKSLPVQLEEIQKKYSELPLSTIEIVDAILDDTLHITKNLLKGVV